MAVTGERPTHGVRLRLVLEPGGRRYAGTAKTPVAEWPLAATIHEDGAVAVEGGPPDEIAEFVRRVVRVAVRNAGDGRPPRVIQRWRAEKE